MNDTLRNFVEDLINKIHGEGVYGEGYGNEEREEDVIRMVWELYESYQTDRGGIT